MFLGALAIIRSLSSATGKYLTGELTVCFCGGNFYSNNYLISMLVD
jgi:hypothetical protein